MVHVFNHAFSVALGLRVNSKPITSLVASSGTFHRETTCTTRGITTEDVPGTMFLV